MFVDISPDKFAPVVVFDFVSCGNLGSNRPEGVHFLIIGLILPNNLQCSSFAERSLMERGICQGFEPF